MIGRYEENDYQTVAIAKLQEILDKLPSVAEGVPTTKAVVELARRYKVEMPITEATHAVLFEGRDVIRALSDLMSRDPKPERNL